MNMPFELGIDYGLRKSGISIFYSKMFLILGAINFDYQKAISDLSGFAIKVYENKTEKIFVCLYSWFSETLNINKQDPPLKIFYDFIDFNTSLFEEKFKCFGSEAIAKNYIENITIPEYINEIKERL